MKFKKAGVLVSAIASTAVCASLIAGSTFALFSDKKEVNIAVTSGKVAVEASVTVESTKSFDVVQTEGKWANGGFAKVDGATVNLVNITPGDEVTLKVTANNKSSVSAKYRCTYNVLDGYLLASGLNVSFGSVQLEDEGGKYQSYATAWDTLGETVSEVSVTISLPSHEGEVDNLYQGLSADIALTVEAVQANGVAGNGEAEHTYLPDYSALKSVAAQGVHEASTESELFAAAAQKGVVKVEKDIELQRIISVTDDLYLVGNGATISRAKDTGNAAMGVDSLTKDVNIELHGVNVVNEFPHESYARGISLYNNTGKVNLLIEESYIEGEHYAINVASLNADVNITVRNSTVKGWCAGQTWSENSKILFENCRLIGTNGMTYNADGWNDFATFVVNEDAAGSEISFKNCVIEANQTTGNKQYFISIRALSTIICEGCEFIKDGAIVTDGADISISAYPSAVGSQIILDGQVITIG